MRIGELLRAGAVQVAVFAQRAAGALGELTNAGIRAVQSRFPISSQATMDALERYVEGAMASGSAYQRLRGDASLPATPPIDLRDAQRREYGAPPVLAGRDTNKLYTYTANVATNIPRADGRGFQSWPLPIESERLLTNAELDEAASTALFDFLSILRNDYERDVYDLAAATNIQIMSATLGYRYPSTMV